MEMTLFETHIYIELRKSLDIAALEPINKGWSGDKKYSVEIADGRRMLLRVSDISELDRKRAEYEMVERVADFGIPVPQPLAYGICNDGKNVYQLFTWIDGKDAEIALPLMTETGQYVLGLKAGKILRKIHSIPTPEAQSDWRSQYYDYINGRLAALQNGDYNFDGHELILDYLTRNRSILENRPRSFRHCDYSIGNILITPDDEPAIIDWETDDFNNIGDPWQDFEDVIWGAGISPHFASGIIRGYWDGNPPGNFWNVIMFYIFMDVMTFIESTARSRPGETENEINYCKKALNWFDNMRNPVPSWYQCLHYGCDRVRTVQR